MRNSRYFFITLAALVLITISIVFISIWGYRTFISDNTAVSRVDTIYALPKDTAKDEMKNESLATVLNEPNDAFDDQALKNKLAQLDQLQHEIKSLLESRKNPDSTETLEKIKQLETDINILQQRNKAIISHNRRLEKTVTQLAKSGSEIPSRTPGITGNATSQSPDVPVKVSNLALYALNNELSETSDAVGTNVLRGTFYVKSNSVSSGELIVVVTGPDNKVLVTGPWESGYFDTPEGRKLYSMRLSFSNAEQRLNFSLNAENLKPGNYLLQIYYKSQLIATLKKTLS